MQAEIALEGMTFYAYHGYYEEERKHGNRFTVDVKVKVDLNEQLDFDSLQNTVNYEILYSIVKESMDKPSKLLENVVRQIQDRIFQKWNFIESAEVSIKKLSPPVGGPCANAKVTLVKFKDK